MIGRREFITLIGGAAATWPLAARAQQDKRKRRVGMLMNLTAADPIGQARLAAFVQRLQAAGWADGRNVLIDARWTGGVRDLFHRYAAELVAFGPDVVLAETR